MKVLIVGGGGREHALAWALARDPAVSEVVATPGNPGIAAIGRVEPGSIEDADGIVDLANREAPDIVVIGPEAPLVCGLADRLRTAGHAVFGPGEKAAMLEGSKAFSKRVMSSAGIPTARSGSFSNVADAMELVDALGGRAVVKADGLAAGKGVVVANDMDSAREALEACLEKRVFGAAGSLVVVEELLEGREVSAFALSDGTRVTPLALAQDFKRARDGDAGPNTGGMGAYSPLPWLDGSLEASIWKEVSEPAIAAMAGMGTPFSGALFAGLMLTEDGPKVLEFNCRFGDPETETLMPRIRSGLAQALVACAAGDLTGTALDISSEACVTVVVASGGYPKRHEDGFPIRGLDAVVQMEGVNVFHSGTALRDGRVVTAGGRVLAVSALGGSVAEARGRAYEAVGSIRFEGMSFRRDIAAGMEGEPS
jgi:phosphoribosylamine--glycine ligase